jgi:hemoglobin
MKIPRAASSSLYARLGGYDRLVRVLDGVSGRLMRDDKLQLFFRGHNETSKKLLKERFVDFVCEQSGGPVIYSGVDMKTAHEGLRISPEDFDRLRVAIRESAQANKFSDAETRTLIEFINQFEKDVVEARPPKAYRRTKN